MAVKDTNNSELDFDSENFDWGDDVAGGSNATASSGRSSLGDDDPFNSVGDDDGFSSDSFYSLEQLPDADGSDSFGDLGGSDFDGLTSDGEPDNYDFGSEPEDIPSGRVITDGFGSDYDTDPFTNSSGDGVGAAPSSSDGATEEDTVDPFADHSGNDDYGQEETAQPNKSSFKAYLLGAVAALIVVAGGVVYVMPSIMGGGTDVEVAQGQSHQAPASSFPSTLPVQGAALQEGQSELAEVIPSLVSPSAPSVEIKDAAPMPLVIPELPTSVPVADTPAPTIALLPEPVVVAAPVVEEDDPLAELVGGKERGGIDAMKGATETEAANLEFAAEPQASSQEFAALSSRLEALEAKVDRLADSFDNFVQVPLAEAAPVASKPSTPVVVGAGLVPPLKPAVFEEVVLKGVAGDVAWVSTKSGVVEVKVGDEVPGVGKVVSFRNYRGDWIVVTTDGLIVRQ